MSLFHGKSESAGKNAKPDQKKERRIPWRGQNSAFFNRYKKFRKAVTKKQRLMLMIALLSAMALLFILVAWVCGTYVEDVILHQNMDLKRTAMSVAGRYQSTTAIVQSRVDYAKDLMRMYNLVERYSLQQKPTPEWEKNIDDYTPMDLGIEAYFVKNGKVAFSSSNARGLGMEEEELRRLVSEKEVVTATQGDSMYTYAAAPMGGGALVTLIRDIEGGWIGEVRSPVSLTQNIPGGDIFVYDSENGDIYGSTAPETEGGKIDSLPQKTKGVRIEGKVPVWDCVRRYVQDIDDYLIVEEDVSPFVKVMVSYDLNYLMRDCVVNMLLPVLFFLVAGMIVVFGVRFVRMIRNLIRDRSEIFPLFKNVYIDMHILRRITSLFLVSLLVLVVVCSYIMILGILSSVNTRSASKLDGIIQEKENNFEQIRLLEEYRDAGAQTLFTYMIGVFEINPDLLSNEHLEKIAGIIGARDITVFDAGGKALSSSSGYVGYSLPRPAEENEESRVIHALYRIIEGVDKASLIAVDSSSMDYYYATKYKTGDGIIRFEFSNIAFQDTMAALRLETVLSEADLGDSDLIYYDAGHPEHALLSQTGVSEVSTIPNPFSEGMLTNEHFGIYRLNREPSYFYVRADPQNEGSFFVATVSLMHLLPERLNLLLNIVTGFIVLYLFECVFMSPCVLGPDDISDNVKVAADDENKSDDEEDEFDLDRIIERGKVKLYNSSREAMEHNFAFFMRILFTGSIIVFVLFLVADFVGSNVGNSLTQYLMNNKWEKGFNIFSITSILISIIFIRMLETLIISLVQSVSENLGPSGLTVGRLLVSLVRFLGLLTIILIILSQMGVNAGTILASAGLTSVVIGIGAQSTVSNILSGLFIIFEGNFRVDDIVEINGWTGKIREIGVRTTCIESFGHAEDYKNLRVINNSDFNNVVNLSRKPSQAVVLLPLEYSADLNRFDELFKQNASSFMDRFPEMMDVPNNDGLLRLDASAKVLRIRARCQEEDRITLERRMLQALVDMAESNGFSIPFDKLVLVQEGEFRMDIRQAGRMPQGSPEQLPESPEVPEDQA